VPTAKNRWKSRRSSKSELCPGPWQYNGLNVASRLPRKQPYSINGVESYLMGRSARASDSSARQPPCNLLVSSSCFRGHVFITFSLFFPTRSSTRVVTVNNTTGCFISLLSSLRRKTDHSLGSCYVSIFLM